LVPGAPQVTDVQWDTAPQKGALDVMTIAGQIGDHQARCLPYLLTLRMLARDDAETPFPWLVQAEVIRATGAILAEAEAAGREVRAVPGGGPDTGIFLGVRLRRLAAAADDAVGAAGAGDFTRLRRHLRRFEVLTSAIWEVQDGARPGPRPAEGPRA
jgi:hypothetical protein